MVLKNSNTNVLQKKKKTVFQS